MRWHLCAHPLVALQTAMHTPASNVEDVTLHGGTHVVDPSNPHYHVATRIIA